MGGPKKRLYPASRGSNGEFIGARRKWDLTGKKFGDWTVVFFKERGRGRDYMWLCKCACGSQSVKNTYDTKKMGRCKCPKTIVGKRFGKLVAIERTKAFGYTIYRCLCDCGRKRCFSRSMLQDKDATCCGCVSAIRLRVKGDGNPKGGKKSKINGYAGSKKYPARSEYSTWRGMITRCYNKKSIGYSNYGGRGITICDGWMESFNNFLQDMGHKPSTSHSIDRLDVNGSYCKENCRWATLREQCLNKRNSRNLSYNGEMDSISSWSRKCGVTRQSLIYRIDILGFSAHDAIEYFLKKNENVLTNTLKGLRVQTLAEVAAKA